MKTLPKFLIFTKGIPDIEIFSSDSNIEVLNLLDIIENASSLTELYYTIQKYSSILVENINLKNVVRYYTILNKNFEMQYNTSIEYGEIIKTATIEEMFRNINLLTEQNQITDYFNIKNDIEELWIIIYKVILLNQIKKLKFLICLRNRKGLLLQISN